MSAVDDGGWHRSVNDKFGTVLVLRQLWYAFFINYLHHNLYGAVTLADIVSTSILGIISAHEVGHKALVFYGIFI